MFETTRIILIDLYRGFRSKLHHSPFLYLFFTLMLIFSLAMFALLTITILSTKLHLTVNDLFAFVFLAFLMKSGADTHRNFIIAPQASYALSTPTSHRQTVGGILLANTLVNLGIWFTFSLLFLVFLQLYQLPLWYPVEYALFSCGVLGASILGAVLALHFFSPYPLRLAPTLVLIIVYGLVQNPLFVALTLPLVILQAWWALSHATASYRYVKRKARTPEAGNAKVRGILSSLFYREVTVLWRERLFGSFVFMSSVTALGTGFLYLHGAELLLPDSLQRVMGDFLPSLFMFLGVYVVVLYTAVFPALNLFLTEDKTLWILQTMPVTADQVVLGKTSALLLCFLTSIPYLALIPLFVGTANLPFLIWFLVFSFLVSVMVAVPFGVKYVGKKSDILLLYSISLILFVVLSLVATWLNILLAVRSGDIILLLGLLLLLVCCGLFLSIKISTRMLRSSSGLS
jgi:hypothetical protein